MAAHERLRALISLADGYNYYNMSPVLRGIKIREL